MADIKFFVDRAGALGKLERTPQGGYRAPAKIARVGLLPYSAAELRRQGLAVPGHFRDSDVVQVYNPPEVLQAALDTLKNAPVTNEHPSKMVGPDNFAAVTNGNVCGETVSFDGTYVCADLAVQDAGLLSDIEIGKRREVSAGYGAVTEFRDGETPDGQPYQAVRSLIVYNHVAVVARGRAGSKVCIALDSMDIPTDEVQVALKINGAEVAVEQAQAAIDSYAATMDAALETAKAEAAALKAKVAELEAQVTEATSDAAIDAAVAARLAKEEAARLAAERLQAVKDAFPALSLEGKSQDYVDALYEASRTVKADPNAALRGTVSVTKTVADAAPAMSAREKMLARNRGQQIVEE